MLLVGVMAFFGSRSFWMRSSESTQSFELVNWRYCFLLVVRALDAKLRIYLRKVSILFGSGVEGANAIHAPLPPLPCFPVMPPLPLQKKCTYFSCTSAWGLAGKTTLQPDMIQQNGDLLHLHRLGLPTCRRHRVRGMCFHRIRRGRCTSHSRCLLHLLRCMLHLRQGRVQHHHQLHQHGHRKNL